MAVDPTQCVRCPIRQWHNFPLKKTCFLNSRVQQKKPPPCSVVFLSPSIPAICCLSVWTQVYGFSMAVFANRTASLHVHTMCSQALKVQHFVLPSLACVFDEQKMWPAWDRWSVHACVTRVRERVGESCLQGLLSHLVSCHFRFRLLSGFDPSCSPWRSVLLWCLPNLPGSPSLCVCVCAGGGNFLSYTYTVCLCEMLHRPIVVVTSKEK